MRGVTWVRRGALAALVLATGVSVQAQGPLGRALERLASEMAELFPKIEGDVIKVEGGQVFIALGATENLREGMELALFRKGEEFKHPLTGVVLGRFEEDLGVLVIKQVAETYASGTLRPAKPNVTVRAGDKVRITKGKIPLALLPLQGELPAWVSRDELVERLRATLEQTGRFQVTAADNVRVYLAEKGIQPGETLAQHVLARMAEELRVTYAVAPKIRPVGHDSALEVSLLGLTYQRTLLTSSAILSPPEPVARAPEPARGPEPSKGRAEVRPGLFKEARKPPPATA